MAGKKLGLITGGKQKNPTNNQSAHIQTHIFFQLLKRISANIVISSFTSFQGHRFLSVPHWLKKRSLWVCSRAMHYFICKQIVWEYTCVLLCVCRDLRVNGKMPGSTALFPDNVCSTMTLRLKDSFSFFYIRTSPRHCSYTESQNVWWEIQ